FAIERENARAELRRVIADLRARARTDEGRRLIDAIEAADREHQAAADRVAALRRTESSGQARSDQFETEVTPRRTALDQAIQALNTRERQQLQEATQAASDTANLATTTVIAITLGLVLAAVVAAV